VVYVQGGFPEWWTVAQVPQTVTMGVGAVIEVEPTELGTDKTLDIAVRTVGEADLVTGQARFRRDAEEDHIENSPYYAPMGWNFIFNVTQLGPMRSQYGRTTSCLTLFDSAFDCRRTESSPVRDESPRRAPRQCNPVAPELRLACEWRTVQLG